MPARSESALRDATKAVPSAENLMESRDGGGNGWTCDNTVNDCPKGYTTWYSDTDAPLKTAVTLTVPVLAVVVEPTDAYNGINPDVEVNEKLPAGMRLLTTPTLSPLFLALITIPSPCDGSASMVICTALLALEPSYMESTLIATVIILQQSVVSVLLDVRAAARVAKVPKLLCAMQ